MKKSVFHFVFLLFIALIGISVMCLKKSNSQRFIKQDLEWNGKQMVRLVEGFYNADNRHYYPESINDLFRTGMVRGTDRMRNPYYRGYFRITEEGEISFRPGNVLYTVASRDERNRPASYRIYVLGKKTDSFFDEEKADEWRNEYLQLSNTSKGPDNIVMAFGKLSENE